MKDKSVVKLKINEKESYASKSISDVYNSALIIFSEKINMYSDDAIREFIFGLNEMFIESCELMKNEHVDKNEKMKISRLKSKLSRMITSFGLIKTREQLINVYFNQILRSEGMNVLPGFFITASITKGGCGKNPERKSIYGKY